MSQNYTLQTYKEFDCNIITKNACNYVVTNLDNSYNPLYIWGGHGVGKTHLLYGIQNDSKIAGKNVMFLDGEWFVKDVINGIRFGKMKNFRERYRTVDVLLIDNIEKIIGKKSSQQELFFTIESLLNERKQIVFTSYIQPNELKCSDERLMSRISMGLVSYLGNYSKENMIEIMSSIAKRNGVTIEKNMAQVILEYMKDDLEIVDGYFSKIGKEKVTTENLLHYMNDIRGNKGTIIDPSAIIKVVADYYQLDDNLLKSKSRDSKVVLARQIAMYLCSITNDESLQHIGRYLQKDRNTVKTSINKMRAFVESDQDMRSTVEELIKQIEIEKETVKI